MDPPENPYAPGAGSPSPELAGRAELLTQADIVFRRLKAGRAVKSFMITGLRGVGKTVLLNAMEATAGELGFVTANIEAHSNKPLTALLYPSLRRILVTLDRSAKLKAQSLRAFCILRGFASAFSYAAGAGLPAGNGRIWPRPASIRRDR